MSSYAQEIRDLPIECSYFDSGCTWQGIIETLDKHLTACEYEFVLCKYQYINCNMEMMRKDIIKHKEEDDTRHLHLALQHMTILTSSDEGTLKVFFFLILSYMFQGIQHAFECLHQWYWFWTGATFISINFCSEWSISFVGHVAVQILNQIGDYNHCTAYFEKHALYPGGCKDLERFVSHSVLCKSSSRVMFIKDDVLYIKVSARLTGSPSWLDVVRECIQG